MSASNRPSPYRYWSDVYWAELGVSSAITSRMARIDRALQGLNVVSELLSMGFDASQDEEELPGRLQLTPSQQERLGAAAWTLHDEANRTMQHLRDNVDNCWGER